MEYTHINDCWNAVRECKTISEVKDLVETFPRWSGDWDIVVDKGRVTMINSYFDKALDSYEEDVEDLDIEVDEDSEDDLEMPWDYGKHFE